MNPLLLFAKTNPCVHTFLGLEPWYQYIQDKIGPAPDCDITNFNIFPTSGNPSDVPLILAAVVDDLLRVAGLIAFFFVIYGGIKFMTSEGNPEHTASARSTVINALVGLVICIVAASLVNFVGTKLGR